MRFGHFDSFPLRAAYDPCPALIRRQSAAGRCSLYFLLGLMLMLGTACNQETATLPRLTAPADTWFPLKIGDHPIRVQVALTDWERTHGLMGRQELDAIHGMLFVFERPDVRSFWMKNTPIALDLGYFSPEGVLLEVHPLFPHRLDAVTSRSDQVQFALEMPQGWFAERGIAPGARLDLAAVRQAITERGYNPRRYGITP